MSECWGCPGTRYGRCQEPGSRRRLVFGFDGRAVCGRRTACANKSREARSVAGLCSIVAHRHRPRYSSNSPTARDRSCKHAYTARLPPCHRHLDNARHAALRIMHIKMLPCLTLDEKRCPSRSCAPPESGGKGSGSRHLPEPRKMGRGTFPSRQVRMGHHSIVSRCLQRPPPPPGHRPPQSDRGTASHGRRDALGVGPQKRGRYCGAEIRSPLGGSLGLACEKVREVTRGEKELRAHGAGSGGGGGGGREVGGPASIRSLPVSDSPPVAPASVGGFRREEGGAWRALALLPCARGSDNGGNEGTHAGYRDGEGKGGGPTSRRVPRALRVRGEVPVVWNLGVPFPPAPGSEMARISAGAQRCTGVPRARGHEPPPRRTGGP